jgi:hypothetical protein
MADRLWLYGRMVCYEQMNLRGSAMKPGEKLEETTPPQWIVVMMLVGVAFGTIGFLIDALWDANTLYLGSISVSTALLGLGIVAMLPQIAVKTYDVKRQFSKFMLSFRVMFLALPLFLILVLLLLVSKTLIVFDLYFFTGVFGLYCLILVWMGIDVIRRDVWPWWTFKSPRR